MTAAAVDALVDLLCGLRPAADAPVQVAALGDVQAVASACRAAWGINLDVRVHAFPSTTTTTTPCERVDLAVACNPYVEWLAPAPLQALRAHLAPGARLLAWTAHAPGTLVPWPAFEVALAEAGFCVERDERVGAGARLVARADPLVVRAGRRSDEAAIRALFARAFQHDPGSAHWRWRYARDDTDEVRASVAVDEHGAVRAHWSGDALAFEAHDERALPRVFLAHHNGDVMTDPSVRRLGRGLNAVLARVARHFWARFGEGQAAVHYGFNTATARAFSLRFVPGVRRFEDVTVWRRVWSAPHPRAGLRAWAARWRASVVERVTCWEADWDAFYERVAPAYGVLARRDARRLTWRYGARPDHVYRVFAARRAGHLQGWVVLRAQPTPSGGLRLEWGDALVDPQAPGVLAALLDAAVLEAVGPGTAVEIAGWFPERPAWWVAQLRAHGFEPGPHPQDLAWVGALFDPGVERSWSRAYYTQGDSDLF